MSEEITVGLIGNPNCGKTTVFNAFTGARQHVGNWPGKTVEKKEGYFKYKGHKINVVDLPGTYSLTAYSIEELVARDYVVDEKPDVVVDIIDSTNLERNLYLAVQLIEMGANLVLAFNMTDLAESGGLKINVKQISERLNVPIVKTTARKGVGLDELKDTIIQAYSTPRKREHIITYGKEIDERLEELSKVIKENTELPEKYDPWWIALKMLEEDKEIIGMVKKIDVNGAATKEAERIKKEIASTFKENADSLIADARYSFIHDIVVENVKKTTRKVSFAKLMKESLSKPLYSGTLGTGTILGIMFLFWGNQIMDAFRGFFESISTPDWLTGILVDTTLGGIGAVTVYIPFVLLFLGIYAALESKGIIKPADSLSDHFDRMLTNRAIGIPLFLLVLFIMFNLTFNVAAPLSDAIDWFMSDFLSGITEGALTAINAPDWLTSLTIDGIIAGVGSVLVFFPFIFTLFFIIAALEDSGYLARAAFVMDKVMHKIGLHGKSFIPLVMGFGCNVPAVMATRVLENERDRILTILINPFMSCGARLPVYVLFAAAFFTGTIKILGIPIDMQTIIVYSLYLFGIAVAIMMGLIFKKTLFKGEPAPFIMELPPYRAPTLRGMLISAWERSKIFIYKAGTIIFAIVVIIWFLAALPPGVEYGSEQSYIGSIGKAIVPLFAPFGTDHWQDAVALFFGFLAKEVVIATTGTLYGIEDVESAAGEHSLINALQGSFTPLSAYAFLVFVLLYIPCMATIAVIKRELGWKWALISLYTIPVAYIFATIVYQLGLLLGLG